MDSSTTFQPSRPRSVKEIAAQAEDFQFHRTIPFQRWIRAADTLYQEASFALSDGDYGRAYLMLMRHSSLVLTFLPTHPKFKEAENQKAYKPLQKRLKTVLVEMEQIKPEIEHAYQEWKLMKPSKEEEEEGEEEPPQIPAQAKAQSYEEFAARDPTLTGHVKILDASENQDLAVDLAREEIRRRDVHKRATKKAGLSDELTSIRRRAGRWDSWDQTSSPAESELQRQMEATRRALDAPQEQDAYGQSTPAMNHNYVYPSISRSRTVDYDGAKPRPSSSTVDVQPARPPKEPQYHARPDHAKPNFPPRPDKTPLAISPSPSSGHEQPRRRVEDPTIQWPVSLPARPKPERLTFKPGAYLENGDPIRSLFIPRNLRSKFLEVAAPNTRARLEMCGILCGRPVNNALFVSCLLIPDQTATSDTCETENETTMFDYMDKEDLLTVGWIHTHPTQTCFMSSRDLHTHAGYQIMMKESVAIVCAPTSTPSHGIFRLTHPPGLDHIISCDRPGIFHPHSIDNLYTSAERPVGHVYESSKLELEIVDLRTK